MFSCSVFTFLVSLCAHHSTHFRFYCTKSDYLRVDGKLRFASYYGDHMVLQKSPEKAVLWGYGPEGAVITVYLSGPRSKQNRAAATVKDGESTDATMKPRELWSPTLNGWKVKIWAVHSQKPSNVTAVKQFLQEKKHSSTMMNVFGTMRVTTSCWSKEQFFHKGPGRVWKV